MMSVAAFGNQANGEARAAWRQLLRHPGVTLTVVLTLGLGIAVVTTSVVLTDQVLLEPLPYPNQDRLAAVVQHWGEGGDGAHTISPAEFFDYQQRLPALEAMGVYSFGWANLLGEGEPYRVPVAHVSAGAWQALRVSPLLGRGIAPDEDFPGSDGVALLSEGLWRRQFGGDPAAVGHRVVLDGQSIQIVGVLPAAFRLPDEMASPEPAGIYLPLALTPARVKIRGGHVLSSVGRLRAGVSLAVLTEQVEAAAQSFTERFPMNYPASMKFGARARGVTEMVIGDARPSLILLLGIAGCVLLIACVNASGLLVAMAESRRHEIAVRLALGATRSRPLTSFLIETGLTAVVAGLFGLLLAAGATRILAETRAIALPRLIDLSLGARALGFGAIVTAFCAVACSLLPAIALLNIDPSTTLRGGGRGSGASGRPRVRRALVVVEIAASAVLLVGAALLAKSLQRLLSVDPGIRVAGVWTVPISLPSASYSTSDAAVRFFQQLDERARAIPGVRAVGTVAGLPLTAPRGELGIELEGQPVAAGEFRPFAAWQVVTPGYFGAIGMRLLRGRVLTSADIEGAPGAAVINETMAQRYWAGRDALGKRFKLGAGAKPDTVTVVGVVTDVRQAGLDQVPEPEMYLAHAQFRIWGTGLALLDMTLVLEAPGVQQGIPAAVRSVLRELAPTVPAGTPITLAQVRADSVARPRFLFLLIAAAAALALVTATVGLYTVVAYSVAQRGREFGVRAALGARGQDLTGLVLRESAVLALAGVVMGGLAALGFSRLLRTMLFGVQFADPEMLIGVPVVLAGVVLLAAFIPARRARRVEPATALREE